jgi:hypothetical protein
MAEVRGGVITQVLYSIGVAAETGLDNVSSATGEAFKSGAKSLEVLADATSKSIEKLTNSASSAIDSMTKK